MDRMVDGNGLKRIYSKVNADSAEDLIFRNHALFELGQLYFDKCDFPNAVDCLEKVKTEALQFHLYENFFRANHLLLRIHAERLHFDKHESLIREVLQVGSSLKGFDKFLAKLYYSQGVAASYKREREVAVDCFHKSLEILQKLILDPTVQGKVLEEFHRDVLFVKYCLAVNEKDLKNYEGALVALAELSKDIAEFSHGAHAFETVTLHDLEASVLLLEGSIFREIGQFPKALDRYWRAHGILKSHRSWSQYYYVLLGLGQTYLQMGNKDRAQMFFELVSDAIGNLELNSLKRILDRAIKNTETTTRRLQIDREKRVILEPTMGEIHFERRFVLLEILYLLASKPGKVFSKEELVDQIWHESYNPMVHDSKVYTSISRLRKLVEPNFKSPIYILNERDGYIFSPAVKLEELGSSGRNLGLATDDGVGPDRRPS